MISAAGLRRVRAAALAVAAVAGAPALAASAPGLQPCRLDGVEHEAQCGRVQRPLDLARPQGASIDVHVAVLPALSRRKAQDPVFFLAGGPGQSAIEMAGPLSRRFSRLNQRRDLVFVDQRGTGRSASLQCPGDDKAAQRGPLADLLDTERQVAQMADCRQALQRLPHGSLQHYTTTIAMADLDAVRQWLGVQQVNLIGASYGTRAGLEYLRQFPGAVRRAVLDGVAPPDMVLPASMAADAQLALDGVLAACDAQPACRHAHPALAARWRDLLRRLPLEARVVHPHTGRIESVTLTRQAVLNLVRTPLYVPALAAALPAALADAADGRFEGLFGLAAALGASGAMAGGMHFSVVCAEDVPRLASAPALAHGDFGDGFAQMYTRICAQWPRGEVPEAFYRVGPTPAAVLLLSGGLDPATPPAHGERTARALGPQARHVVVAHAGHGVTALPCVADLVQRFIDAEQPAQALALDTGCAAAVPRPDATIAPWRAAPMPFASAASKGRP